MDDYYATYLLGSDVLESIRRALRLYANRYRTPPAAVRLHPARVPAGEWPADLPTLHPDECMNRDHVGLQLAGAAAMPAEQMRLF